MSKVVGPYTLALRFEDGTHRQTDLEPIVEGDLFGPLRDRELFRAVEIDADFGTVQWPTGADRDPDTLYDWPKYRDACVAMARQRAKTPEPAHRITG